MKINSFSLIFKVPGRFWGFENVKKSKKVSSERLRGANNDVKRGQEGLRKRKMSQHEAPKGYDTDWGEIEGRTRGPFSSP